MSGGERVPWADGMKVADELLDAIGDVTERREIAGSLRRRTEDVGDVELVVVPRMEKSEIPDGLWGTAEINTNLLLERLPELLAGDRWAPHPEDPKAGERYAKFIHAPTGLQVDLFMVLPPAQFGIIHLIRTGPATYSEWFVKAVRRHGYHVKDGALHWGTIGCSSVPCAVADTPNEKDVFAKTQIAFTPAQFRGEKRAS
jgi:DNA polymerase/3'-5' exonuclease PolX